MNWLINLITSLFSSEKVTKLKLKWNAPQLINSVMAYDILKKSRGYIAEFCEFSAANGYTIVGVELGALDRDFPGGDVEKYLRGQVDKMEPLLAEADKRNLGVKVIANNSNSLYNKKIVDQGVMERLYKYIWDKYAKYRRIMMVLPINERDSNLRPALIDEAVRDAEGLWPREQTVAYSIDRGDADFTEWHPQKPKASLSLPRHWSTLTTGDSGGHLSGIKHGGSRGQTPMEPQYVDAHAHYINLGTSVEVYDFIQDFKPYKHVWAEIGKRFRAKHGGRVA